MVKGIRRFREHFRAFEAAYVVIGGVACDEWMGAQQLRFRATKDVDIVLVVEALTDAFVQRFWEFIRLGGYQTRQKAEGKREYYRFLKATQPDYPAMIELFSKPLAAVQLATNQEITPIPAGEDMSSLSAMLLEEGYYSLILEHRHSVDGLPLASVEALIPLKAKAWLELRKQKTAGYKIDDDDINKHRTDVFRLALTLTGERRVTLRDPVRSDLRDFLAAFSEDAVEWGAIRSSVQSTAGVSVSPKELLSAVTGFFGL